jgi:hypothetical protein
MGISVPLRPEGERRTTGQSSENLLPLRFTSLSPQRTHSFLALFAPFAVFEKSLRARMILVNRTGGKFVASKRRTLDKLPAT